MSHQKGLWLLYGVAFMDLFAVSMVTTQLSQYLTDELKLSASLSGSITSIYGFIQLFSGPLVGGESDVKGYRTVLLSSILLCIPAYALLSSKWWIFIVIARALAGCFKHTQNLCKTMIGASLPHNEQLAAFGRINSMGSIGFIVGPSIGGHIHEILGYEAVFVTVAAIFLANAAIVFLFFNSQFDAKPSGKDKEEKKGLFDLVRSVDWVRHWDVFLSRFILSFAVLIYRSNLNWFLKQRFGFTPKQFGYITSFQGLISFLAAFFVEYMALIFSDKISFYAISCITLAAAIFGLLLADSVMLWLVFAAMFSTSTAISRTLGYDLTTERCNREEVGLLMGVSASVVSFARAFSPALGGVLHDLGMEFPGLAGAVAALLGAFVTIYYTRLNQPKFSRSTEKTK